MHDRAGVGGSRLPGAGGGGPSREVPTAPARPPTRADLQRSYGATIPDLVGPGMRALLVGINPSLYSGWTGRHFARPGNRLWRTLHEAGFTERLLHPSETGRDGGVSAAGCGSFLPPLCQLCWPCPASALLVIYLARRGVRRCGPANRPALRPRWPRKEPENDAAAWPGVYHISRPEYCHQAWQPCQAAKLSWFRCW